LPAKKGAKKAGRNIKSAKLPLVTPSPRGAVQKGQPFFNY